MRLSTISAKPELPEDPWDSVSWEGCERLQLRRERQFSLREKILAMEGMGEVARRLSRGRKLPAGGSQQQ